MHSRREFLNGMTLAGTAAFWGVRPPPVAAEPPPETTRIKLAKIRGICIAPQYVAEELLRAEGFTDVQYVQSEAGTGQAKALGSGEVEMSMNFAAPLIVMADGGAPLLVLAGVHVGCFELFGNNRVRSIRDLKGKTVGVQGLGSSAHIFITSMKRCGCSPKGRSTPSSDSHQSRRRCARRRSATWSSTARSTVRGLSTSAA